MKNKVLAVSIFASIIIVLFFILYMRPIKIGILLTTDTTFGSEENMALRFYSNKRPVLGMRPIKYLFKNPKLDDNEIVKSYRELEEDGVSVIIGGSISRTGALLAQESKRSAIPTFGITTSSEIFSGKKDSYYRIVPASKIQASAIIPFLESKNIKRLAIITSTSNREYSESYSKALKEKFNGSILVVPFDSFHKNPDGILNWKPHSVFCILNASNFIQAIKAVKKSNRSIIIIGSAWSSALISIFSGPLLDDVILTSQRGPVLPEYQNLIKEFENLYHFNSSFASINAISILNIALQGLREAGPGIKNLNRYFEGPRIYEIGYGLVYIDEYGDAIVPNYYAYKILNGKKGEAEIFKIQEFPWDKVKK